MIAATPTPSPATPKGASCATPTKTQIITFSTSKYPHIHAHVLHAIASGWPRILTLNRPGAAARRTRLLADVPTKAGYDRDEYPPAEARGKGFHIRGVNPIGWMANVKLVPSHENRSQGASMEAKLRPYCNGTKFRYAWN